MKTKLDIQAANELKLYPDNEFDFYDTATRINANLARKRELGIYDHAKACKAFGFVVKLAAIKYCREFSDKSTRYYDIFNAATRRAVCEMLANDFEGEVE